MLRATARKMASPDRRQRGCTSHVSGAPKSERVIARCPTVGAGTTTMRCPPDSPGVGTHGCATHRSSGAPASAWSVPRTSPKCRLPPPSSVGNLGSILRLMFFGILRHILCNAAPRSGARRTSILTSPTIGRWRPLLRTLCACAGKQGAKATAAERQLPLSAAAFTQWPNTVQVWPKHTP